eukprot:869037-Pyramimonas_sp.AAC.1
MCLSIFKQNWWFAVCGSRLDAAHIRPKSPPAVVRIEGGSFSKCGSRLTVAHIRLNCFSKYTDEKGVCLLSVALASVLRSFFLKASNIYTDGGGHSQHVSLASAPRTYAFNIFHICTDGGRLRFKCGPHPSAAHIRHNMFPQLHGRRFVSKYRGSR